MKTSKAAKKTAKVSPRELPETFYRVKALLQTMRCISQHEDRLCTLLHSVEQDRAVEPDVLDDLQTLLNELPAHEYTHDLAAVQKTLASPLKAKTPPEARKQTKKQAGKKAVKRTSAKP